MKADLHTHTIYSDGKLSVKELIEKAINYKLDYISITDHDTLEAYNDIFSNPNYKYNDKIKIVAGIEISTTRNNESVHLLGYFKNNNYDIKELKEMLLTQKRNREERAEKIIVLLKQYFNIILDYNEIKQDYGIVARPHIANAIIKKGYNYTYNEVFRKLIGTNCLAYVPTSYMTTKEGIEFLKRNNALAILAHPSLLRNNNLEDIIALGVDGIEAFYPSNTIEQTNSYLAYKDKILVTGGSDYHGDNSHYEIGSQFLEGENLNILLKKLNLI